MPPKTVVKESLSEQIYRNLRLSLMDGEYRPGERLTISSVAEQYGTSITPVREAIFRLASEQALEVKAATSVIVPALTSRDLREIVAIRNDLEGMAAYRVGQVATVAMIEELDAQMARDAAKLAKPDLYMRDHATFAKLTAGIEAARAEKEAAELRWLELAEQVDGVV